MPPGNERARRGEAAPPAVVLSKIMRGKVRATSGRLLRLLPLEDQHIWLVPADNVHRHRQGLQIG